MIVPKCPAEQNPTQKPTPTRKSKLGRELSLPSFFYGIPDDLSRLADTFLIRMSIHPQGHSLVAMAQGLGYTGNVGTVGDGNAGKRVTQLVRMEIGGAVPLGEFLQVAGGTLGVHWLRAGLFCEHIGAETFLRLFYTKLAKQRQGVVPNVHGAGVSVFWCIQIDALC